MTFVTQAVLKVLGTRSVNNSPTRIVPSAILDSSLPIVKIIRLHKVASKIVDDYVMDKSSKNNLINKTNCKFKTIKQQ